GPGIPFPGWWQAPQFLQDDFDAVGVLPLCQHCRGSRIHHSIRTAHAAHIDSCYKFYRQGCLWVLRPTLYLKAVYSVFIDCSWRPNYHACPSCKCHALVVLQTPANCAIAYSFLSFFQFF
ncbi:mCG144524, partial [Mus musculus]